MTPPEIKGWCPGALRPMESGDGLIVRVRPWKGRLSREQAIGLCDVADAFGNGTIDLTSRANLQIRGIRDHAGVIASLSDLDLLDPDPLLEGRRNVIVAPLAITEASGGDISIKKKILDDLHDRLMRSLPHWPDLPNKMGLALDIGTTPILQNAAADFRFEMSDAGMILRADGAATGVKVTLDTAVSVLMDLMDWFVASAGVNAGRMKRHLADAQLPDRFQGTAPLAHATRPAPGQYDSDILVGAAFGQIQSDDLRDVMGLTQGIQVTPWRMILLEGTSDPGAFITNANDSLLHVNACPGAPSCLQGWQETRDLARMIAPKLNGRHAHISGCRKGCAHPHTSDVAIVGTKGGYDLVRNGAAWDTPARTGLTPQEILEELAR